LGNEGVAQRRSLFFGCFRNPVELLYNLELNCNIFPR
jgi:hypothetical protein